MKSTQFLRQLLEIRALFSGKVPDATLERFLRHPHTSDPWQKVWVYGESPWDPIDIFLPWEKACFEALQTVRRLEAKTWGDFVRSCDPEDRVRQAVQEYHGCETPADDDEFDETLLSDMNSGHYINLVIFWPEVWMIGKLPGAVEERYGKLEPTVQEGDVLHFHRTYRPWILEEFAEEGHLAVHDPTLTGACENDPGDHDLVRRQAAWYRTGPEALARVPRETRRLWEEVIQAPLPENAGADRAEPEIEADTWLRGKGNPCPLPEDAVFLISYEASAQGLAEYEEAVFFRRTTDRDELWVARDNGLGGLPYTNHQDTASERFNESDSCTTGLAAWAALNDSAWEAAYRLLADHLDSVSHDSQMLACQDWGLFECSDYKEIVEHNQRRWGAARAASARRRESISAPILDAVRELGLHLEPAGEDPHSWYASCPGRNHMLMVQSHSNEFGCGYCRIKGGVDELRALVEERRNR